MPNKQEEGNFIQRNTETVHLNIFEGDNQRWKDWAVTRPKREAVSYFEKLVKKVGREMAWNLINDREANFNFDSLIEEHEVPKND